MDNSSSSSSSSGKSSTSFQVSHGHLLSHVDGHQRYRTSTASPSDGEEIRWYFSKGPLSVEDVAASSPATEVVAKGDFLRFSVNDSLTLEAAFLRQEEELVSAWWKEYAECSEGPIGSAMKEPQTASTDDSIKVTDLEHLQAAATDVKTKQLGGFELLYENDEIIGVLVKGGLYEVDLHKRRCYPIYWTGDHRRVLRGHWFAQKGGLDWLPLREDVSEQLEFAYRSQIWHRRTFQPSGKFAARVNLQSSVEGLHALFTGEDDSWEAWLHVDASGISSVLGLRGVGVKLRRGFAPSESPQPTQDELQQRKEEEMDDYCSQVPVRHLVFMVHGIGQRLENANLVDDVGNFRRITALLAEQHLTTHQRNSQRVLFIPCQWRRGLKLAGEEAVENCTLEGVRALRTMLSATVHDVLYYMSPVYCQEINDSVCGQLNRLYQKFIKRNPGYDGKVSLYGHSLGSVLAYDILCHQSKLFATAPISQINGDIQTSEVDSLNLNQMDEKISKVTIETKEMSVDSLESLRNQMEILKQKIASLEEAHQSNKQLIAESIHEDERSKNSTEETRDKEETEKSSGKDEPTQGSEDESYKISGGDIRDNTEEHSKRKIEGDQVTASLEGIHEDSIDEHNKEHFEQDSSLYTDEPSPETSHNKHHWTKLSLDYSKASVPENSESSSPSGSVLKTSCMSRKRYTPYIEYTKLAFEVDTFFAVGSPLGVFLSLRNVRLGIGKGQDYWQDDDIDEELPACKRMFNIFHPYDPVAYRIEPLVCKEYMYMQPEFVPYHRGGRRLHIGVQEFGKDFSARSRAFVQSLSVVRERVVKAFSVTANKGAEEDMDVEKPRTYGSLMIEKLTGELDGRIDFMLQDATFEHSYLQAISSHTSYWLDLDTALFIIKHLYHEIPEENLTLEGEVVVESIDESVSLDSSPFVKEKYVIDDDFAFTFSRRSSIINSTTDKKMLKSSES